MKILFLHSAREWSGTARVFARAGRGLAERGAKVVMLVPPDSNVELGVSTQAKSNAQGTSDAPYEVIPYTTGGSWYLAARRLRHLFRRWDTDVVFVTTDREHLIAAVTCWLGRRGRVIRRIPAGEQLEMNFAGRFAAWLSRTAFFFASDADRHSVILPPKSIDAGFAELGIDIDEYAPVSSPGGKTGESAAGDEPASSGLKYIVCVYDPSSRSRAATAIRTISMLAPRHPDLRLVIFGAGSDDEDLRMQAAALRILHLVSLLGERDDQLHLMRDAHLGWVVAEGDTAAYGLLDLMALGIPVIASERGVAQRYVASGISGTLYPPEDSASTAAAVAGLIASEDSRLAMGKAARTRVVRDFSESEMVDGFDRAVQTAVGRVAGRK